MANRVTVAVIGAPVGVRGSVRVISHSAEPGGFARFTPLYLDDSARVMAVANARQERDDSFIVDFAGITNREQAAKLRHARLTIARSQLPEPDEEEFYLADLIGLHVVAGDGADLGTVVGVMNHGAGDILEICPAAGGDTALYPFTKACVPNINLAAGILTLIAPD